jgi:2-oxoisovalerate dehydrogenase E1 component
MLPVIERAATRLEQEEELSVEIVSPSLLAPMPKNTLVGLLLARQRIAVIEESHHEFGVSAELVASLAEAGYRGSIVRIGMPPVPIASARSLERSQLPDEQAIVDKVLGLF